MKFWACATEFGILKVIHYQEVGPTNRSHASFLQYCIECILKSLDIFRLCDYLKGDPLFANKIN
jgi:hypothetical protein